MKYYYILCIVVAGSLHAYPQLNKPAYIQSLDTIYGNLDRGKVPSQILMDRALGLIDLTKIDGKHINHVITRDTILTLYSELHLGHFNMELWKNVFTIDSLASSWKKKNNIIPILLIQQNYHQINPDALKNGLVTKIGNQLKDISPRGKTPFDKKSIFAVASLVDKLESNEAYFSLPSFLYFSSDSIKDFVIDFDDGKGFRELVVNKPIHVVFPYKDEAIITIRSIHGGDTLISRSRLRLPLDVLGAIPTPVLSNMPSDSIALTVNGKEHYYGTWLGCSNFYLRKPVIIVEGYDPMNTRYLYSPYIPSYPRKNWDRSLYAVANEQKMADKLRNAGYDIVILNFADGLDPLEDQAQVVEALIREVNRKLAAVGSYHELVIIGPSSGGIIARYALAEMEGRGEDHNTRLYISFDAPHQGANVPLGLQHVIRFIDNTVGLSYIFSIEPLKKMKDVFFATPTKELLVYHASETGDGSAAPAPEFYNFFNTLNSLNGGKGYPVKCRKIAIANGSGNGTGYNFNPGDKLFAYNIITPKISIIIDGRSVPNYSRSLIFSGAAFYKPFLLPPIPLNVGIFKVDNTGPYDNAPGGAGAFVDALVSESNVAGFGCNTCQCFSDDLCKQNFIPTISALDLRNTTDLFYNVHANLTGGKNEAFALGSSITPFDAIFVSSTNTKHVIEGLTPEIAAFVCDEVMPMNLYIQNRSIVGNKEFEGLQSITIGQNVSSRYASGSVNIISNSGTITFRAGETISLQSGTSITANGGSVGFKLTRFASCGAACRIAYEEDLHSQYSTYQEPITQIASAKSNNYFNYPNPFNDHTHIAYTLNKMAYVKMDIFNMWGQLISTLVNEQQEVGEHVVAFDASKLLSGVYMCRLVIDGELYTIKMICHKQ